MSDLVGGRVRVTQADREAAAGFYGPHLARPGEVLVTAHMRAGKIDESPLIQAFAAHRVASAQGLMNDTPDFRRLALAAGSQAATAVAELVMSAHEGPLHYRTVWNDEPIEKLADATKLAIEASIAAGERCDDIRNQLLGALTRYLEGWAG